MTIDEISQTELVDTGELSVPPQRPGRPVRLMVMPRDRNPYQELLHDSVRDRGVTPKYIGGLTPSLALNALLLPIEILVLRLRGFRVLHIHWIYNYSLANGAAVPGLRQLAFVLFRSMLTTCRLAGVRVVWTAHNVLPHSPVFADDLRARRVLVAHADVVIVHSMATLAELRRLGLEPRRWRLAPHPAYPVCTKPIHERSAATHFVFAGAVSPHKGVDELLAAFARLGEPQARLTVAGKCTDAALLARVRAAEAEDPRISARLDWLDEQELVDVLHSASYVVLPYREVTTSGLAMLALSAGRPLIVPALPGFADLPSEAVERYDATEPQALAAALRRTVMRGSAGVEERARAASGYAAGRTWDVAATQAYDAYVASPADDDVAAGPHRRLISLARRLLHAGDFESAATHLLLNLILSSVAGFAATILLTHVFSPAQVGLGSVAISLSGIAATFSQLGLDYSILRYLPRSEKPEQIINTTITVGSIVTLLVSVVLLAIPQASGRLLALGAVGITIAFLLGNLVNALQAQLELILVAQQRSRAVWRLNIPANLSKLVFPFVFVSLGALGVFVSQAASIALSVVLMSYALAKAGVRYRPSVNLRATAELWRFSIGAFIAGLAGSAPLYLLPLIIVARFGARANAYWFAAMAIAMAIYQLASTINQALLSQASRLPEQRREILLRGLRLTFAIMLPSLAAAYLVAPTVLVTFGHHYSTEGTAALRWLILGGLCVSCNYITGTILYLDKRTQLITWINLVNAAFVIGYASIFANSLAGVGRGWLLGELVNVVLFSAGAWWTIRRHSGRWDLLGEPA